MALRQPLPARGHDAQNARDHRTQDAGIIRVLVADDHPPTRAGVRIALERRGLYVCAEAADAETAVAAAFREHPDVCLLDLRIPGGGIAATAAITAKLPDTAVVVLADEPGDGDLFDALRAGAAGFLLKDTNPSRLADVLRGVLRGEAALPRRLVSRLMEEFRERGSRQSLEIPGGRAVELTGREWEVLELMRRGLATQEIAQRLFISPGTVRTHVAAILRKLRVPDREAALRLLR